MHPAASIIVFTVLSGLGYGLAAVLGLGILDPAATATRAAHLMALGLISAGLLASTLHLGNPQRAWRALSQWRSSWLSREGVMALVTFLPLLWSAWASICDGRYLALPGLLGALGSVVTVFCTAMIYASLRSVQAWNTPLTAACYLLSSAAGGLVFACAVAALGGGNFGLLGSCAIAALAAATIAKIAWRRRMSTQAPLSTPESATGLGFIGRVRLFERPHTNENYLTREMGFRIARKHAAKLVRIGFLLVTALPIILLLLAIASAPAMPVLAAALAVHAALFHVLGMMVERWLFFAEAKHAVMTFYQGTAGR